jgi:O-methyltransferase involved in polyketide biosynthesis
MSTDADSAESRLVSTMVGPLWARAAYGQLYPELLYDSKAAEVYAQVKARHPEAATDFVMLEEFVDEFLGIMFLVRARTFDDAIRQYLEGYPAAVIVNLGCGLDTTFSRVDNGRLRWFDLDLPEAIEYRRHLLPESPRNRYIAQSVLDFGWFDQIHARLEKGVFLISGGLFDYFQESVVAQLCGAMATRFPGGELLFDASSRIGNIIMNRRFKNLGAEELAFHLSLGNPSKQVPRWSDHLQVVDWFPLFARTNRDPRWRRKTRFLMWLCDWLKVVKIVHVKFRE